MVNASQHPIKKIAYQTPKHFITDGTTYLETPEGSLPLKVFGRHNLSNLAGAQWIAQLMGINSSDFYEAILSFKGASKRLELLIKGSSSFLYKDFAHAPSKVKATATAVKTQFNSKKITVCLELHTYSSLDPEFIKQYNHSLESVEEVIVFYDPEALKIKSRAPIPPQTIREAFAHSSLQVFTQSTELHAMLLEKEYSNEVLVMMSSGNFGGIDWEALQTRFK